MILKPHVLLLQLTTILLHIIVMPINAKNLVYYKRLSIVFPFFRHCNRWVIYTVQMKKLIWAVFTTFLTMNISLSNYSNKPRILTKNMLQYFILFKCHLYHIIIWEIQKENVHNKMLILRQTFIASGCCIKIAFVWISWEENNLIV